MVNPNLYLLFDGVYGLQTRPGTFAAAPGTLFLTPGIIFGRFTIRDRVRLIFGAGYQFSVSPAVPAYRNGVILTLRSTF